MTNAKDVRMCSPLVIFLIKRGNVHVFFELLNYLWRIIDGKSALTEVFERNYVLFLMFINPLPRMCVFASLQG